MGSIPVRSTKYMTTKLLITATIYNRKGRVLSTGVNSYVKTHPKQQHFADRANLPEKSFLHAEIASLVKLKNGVAHKIKVERYGKSGQPLNAEPCPICKLAIKAAGISFVEYTVGE